MTFPLSPLTCPGPTIRDHIGALKMEVTPEGIVRWEHSDILSALLIARTSMLRVVSV